MIDGVIKKTSNVGYSMFAKTSEYGINRGSMFGNNLYVFYNNTTDNIVDINDLLQLIATTWDTYKNSNKYDDDKFYHINDIDSIDIAQMFNPESIVDSAVAYDDLDLAYWFWDYVITPNHIDAVITNDGAIVYNHNLIIDTGYTQDDIDDLTNM